ncbi:MAG: hypothetical protein IH951_03990 [Bacteroidetes bacterium]|nr:hypothetical protein [Bacteroidota bacterium]
MVLALVGSVWAQVREHKLTASDSARSDHFGGSVSLSGGGHPRWSLAGPQL